MNTIDAYRINSGQTFNARLLKFHNESMTPLRIVEAVYKSSAVNNFLRADKKRNVFQKLVGLFKRNEVLEVKYYKDTEAQRKSLKNPNDPYESHATLSFDFGLEGEKNQSKKLHYEISDFQQGVYKKPQNKKEVSPKDERSYYDEPLVSVEDKIAEKIEKLGSLKYKLRGV